MTHGASPAGAPVPDLLRTRLLPGERVLWFDRPRQGLMVQPRDALLIPFSLLWGGFAVFWEWSVLHNRAPGFMALFGVPFVLVGLFMVLGRFPLDAWLRRRTIYALTDRRVLVARAAPWGVVRSLALDRLPETALVDEAGTRGTIRFGERPPMWLAGSTTGWSGWVPALDPTLQFLQIEDAQRVFDEVQRLARGRSGST